MGKSVSNEGQTAQNNKGAGNGAGNRDQNASDERLKHEAIG
jgi:hypothetical protein